MFLSPRSGTRAPSLPRLEHKVSVYDYTFRTDTNLIGGAAAARARGKREDEQRLPKRRAGRLTGSLQNTVEIHGVNVEPSESPEF